MIDLPRTPGPVDLNWQQIDFGGDLTPALGGPAQRVNRNGNRFAVTVTLPAMTPAVAAAWVAALNAAVRSGARWRVRQVEMVIGVPGAPVVNGGGQAGSTLAITGGQPRYTARTALFFSLLSGGQRYLHLLTAATQLDASGAGTLAFETPLRVEPENGDAVEIAQPIIEGKVSDGGFPWSISRARRVGITFTITERA